MDSEVMYLAAGGAVRREWFPPVSVVTVWPAGSSTRLSLGSLFEFS
jgi:hypothetical protein